MSLIVGAVLLFDDTLPGQVAGMLARVMGASALAITLNLYIMDHIRKADVHAGRIAAHGLVDARLDRRPDARRAALYAFRHRRRRIGVVGAASL